MEYSFLDISNIPETERPKFLQTLLELGLSYYDSDVPAVSNGLANGLVQPQQGPVNGPQHVLPTPSLPEAPVDDSKAEEKTPGLLNGLKRPRVEEETQPAPEAQNGPVNAPERGQAPKSLAKLNPDAPVFQPTEILNRLQNPQPAQTPNVWCLGSSVSYADRVKKTNLAASRNNTPYVTKKEPGTAPQAASRRQPLNCRKGLHDPKGDNGVGASLVSYNHAGAPLVSYNGDGVPLMPPYHRDGVPQMPHNGAGVPQMPHNGAGAPLMPHNGAGAPLMPKFTLQEYHAMREAISEFLNKKALSVNDRLLPPEPRGLYNSSQDCFVLCILQMLLQTKRFASLVRAFNTALRNHSLQLLEKDAPFLSNLLHLWRDYNHCPPGKHLSNNYIMDILWRFNNVDIRRGWQGDAMEFLSSFMQRLQEECRPLREVTDLPKNPFQLMDMNTDTNCPFGRIFVGSLIYKSNQSTSRPEPFLDLSLAIIDESICSVNDAFQAFFREENLPNTTRQTYLSELPQALILSLKNSIITEDGRSIKVDKQIKIDEALTVDSRLLAPALKEKYGSRKIVYNLSAGVFHEGLSSQRGHYWAFSRKGSRTWNKMNDKKTSVLSDEELHNQHKFVKSTSPYCLTYELCLEQ